MTESDAPYCFICIHLFLNKQIQPCIRQIFKNYFINNLPAKATIFFSGLFPFPTRIAARPTSCTGIGQ